MTFAEKKALQVGDRFRVNHLARTWACGRVFTIDEIHWWGVRCFARIKRDDPYFGLVYIVKETGTVEGNAYYRAAWIEIEEQVS
jgi:hypothetical protein